MSGVIERVNVPENETPEEAKAAWKDIFDKLVEDGIITPNKDAPPCMGCGELLEQVKVTIILTIGEEVPIDTQEFQWIPGLHQFNASPSFFRFVTEGMGRFETHCSKCDAEVMGMEVDEKKSGLVFADDARMAGNL